MIEGVIESRVCLKPMISDDSHTFIRLYSHYKNQLLPLGGGLLEQPNVFIQAMEAIESLINSDA